jgi:hypothetical protein
MKKIFLGLSVLFAILISSQNYPDYYPSDNNTSYNDYDDEFYFPDNYYYEYPSDYYTNDLYQGYYNDYRRSIVDVNWNRFFSQYRLAPWQIQQIIMLNDSYASYASWNSYYRFNPDRWYYDRFYALERILGPQVFMVFQNNYYNGYNPIVYYQNYRRQHYVTNIYVINRYRNININRYKIDRTQYHQSNPRNSIGFNNTTRNGNGNWQNNSNNGGFRNDATMQNNTRGNGFRNQTDAPIKSLPNNNNNGQRNNGGFRTESTTPKNNEGIRNNDSGFRNTTPQRKIQNNPNQQKAPSSGTRSSNNSGMRFTRN